MGLLEVADVSKGLFPSVEGMEDCKGDTSGEATETALVEVKIVDAGGGNPPVALMSTWKCLLGVRLRCRRLLKGEHRWPGQEMVTWLWTLRNGCVSCFFLRPRPPVQGGELMPGKDRLGLRDVAAAHDCRVGVGVDGLLGIFVRGGGVRSRTWERWPMRREVMVLGLRKEVVWSTLKMAVRWR